MLGSMYSAVSGLQAHQTKMNVIGNNIANVNTYGFKSSRVTFSDVFYQTMSAASSPAENSGGTNPTQMGYGSKVNSIDVINTRAGSATTDRALDVYINGDGYLPVSGSDGVIRYTRVGVLSFDSSGNLVDRNGNKVLGFAIDPDTGNALMQNDDGTDSVDHLVSINVDPEDLEKFTGISIGQNGEVTAVKEGDPAFTAGTNTGWIVGKGTVTADSTYNGAMSLTINQEFTPAGTNPQIAISSNADIGTGNINIELDGGTYTLTLPNTDEVTALATDIDTTTTPNTLTFNVPDVDGGNTATVTVPIGTGGYTLVDAAADTLMGAVDPTDYTITGTISNKSGEVISINDTWDSDAATPDTVLALGNLTLNIDGTLFQNALDEGFTDVEIGRVGPGAGTTVKIAQLSTVSFINADGLSQDGEGYYLETTNSGDAVATIPGNGGTGNLRAGALEMSNVDLSKEFTEMIITQRGFQANTRMITVSDEMLQELVSMKR